MAGETRAELRQRLRRLHPLNQLTDEALSRLIPELRVVSYAASTSLYGIGESPEDNFYVLSGCVCLHDADGPQMKIRPAHDQDVVPLPYAVPSDERAAVVESSVVLQVSRALLLQALEQGDAPGEADSSAPAGPAAAPNALPQPAVPSATVAGTAAHTFALTSGSRVLLVEHQSAEASVCRALLKSMELRSDWARSAEEAIELLQIEQYGAVLLDLQLPDGDALDVVKFVRQNGPAILRPGIIALTGSYGDREGCLAAGMDDVICPPLTAETLAAKLGQGGQHTAKRRVASEITLM
ncbi:MAG TPA: response regulator [Solimonas sp.]|nr:response regulator [Solimonas sp.]